MCVADGDPADFYSRSERRCARPFDCSECGAHVERGAIYSIVSAKWEGLIETFKRCVACAALGDAVVDVDCSWAFGSLLDDAVAAVDPFGLHADAEADAQGRLIGLLWLARERCDAARETRQLRRAAA